MNSELARLRALLNLAGIRRKDAAKALHLSCSALNRKLRGDLCIHPEEVAGIERLAQRGREEPS